MAYNWRPGLAIPHRGTGWVCVQKKPTQYGSESLILKKPAATPHLPERGAPRLAPRVRIEDFRFQRRPRRMRFPNRTLRVWLNIIVIPHLCMAFSQHAGGAGVNLRSWKRSTYESGQKISSIEAMKTFIGFVAETHRPPSSAILADNGAGPRRFSPCF